VTLLDIPKLEEMFEGCANTKSATGS